MSVPESNNSKGRPSLLSETAPGAADTSSRILASLEGRVVAQQAPRPRSKKPLIAVVLAVVGVAAFGTWQWQRGQVSEHPVVAAATNAGKTPAAGGASVVAATAAVTASGAAASAHVAQGDGASAPQAAVIVAEDSSHSDTPVAASGAADPLSQALASGAAPAGAQAVGTASSSAMVATASAPAAVVKQQPAKAVASRDERDGAKGRRAEKLAAAHAGKHARGRAPGAKDDPDADLLAALVARTKPYEANAPRDASATAAAKAAQPAAKAHAASLSDQVKACEKGNFFEAQICRWRVCTDHWGKDPACPSPNNTASAAPTK